RDEPAGKLSSGIPPGAVVSRPPRKGVLPRHKGPARMDVKRTGIILKPSNTRVVIRPFEVANESRIEKIIARISSLPEDEVARLREGVMREFRERHQRTCEFFLHRFEQVRKHLLTDQPLSENRRLLIGSYFTQEYALESAALFNPSMVWHPDQSGLPDG